MSLLNKIKILCVESNMTISALEKTLGIGNGTISRWSKVIPSGDKLLKVANYFDVSVDYLLDRTDNKNTPDTSEVSDIYFSLAKELQDSNIDPDDVKMFVKLVNKNKKK